MLASGYAWASIQQIKRPVSDEMVCILQARANAAIENTGNEARLWRRTGGLVSCVEKERSRLAKAAVGLLTVVGNHPRVRIPSLSANFFVHLSVRGHLFINYGPHS